jgi:Superinfection immunity protein
MEILFILALCLLAYFFPWIVALCRGHQATLAIFILNLFLGWSGLGWVAALVWACMPVTRTREIVQ